jgi:hypothetical protein
MMMIMASFYLQTQASATTILSVSMYDVRLQRTPCSDSLCVVTATPSYLYRPTFVRLPVSLILPFNVDLKLISF